MPLIVGTVKDIDSIFYCIENQVRGLCIGGDMVIFEKPEKRPKVANFVIFQPLVWKFVLLFLSTVMRTVR